MGGQPERAGALSRTADHVDVHTAAGNTLHASQVVLAVPLNTMGAIAHERPLSAAKQAAIALGQASRGGTVLIEVEGATTSVNAIRPGHGFGYLASEFDRPGGRQIMIGFGIDAAAIEASDGAATQAALDRLIPGLRVVAAISQDWPADPYPRGTWAIHRPGWYTRHNAAMRGPGGACCSPAPTSRTAGRGSSTARSSRASRRDGGQPPRRPPDRPRQNSRATPTSATAVDAA